MKYNQDLHNRHSIRLPGHDYSNAGSYFVTVCLNQRIPRKWRTNATDAQTNVTVGSVGAAHRGCPCCTQTNVADGQTNVANTQTNVADGQKYFHQKGQPRWVAPTFATKPKFDFPIFGMVENGVMVLNDSGKMVQQTWNEMPEHCFGFEIGEFIVMPDHIHGIITINGICPGSNPTSLPQLVHYLKTRTTNKYIDGVKTQRWLPFHERLWQRNYWEHIIRNEAEFARITEYIRKNPILWEKII